MVQNDSNLSPEKQLLKLIEEPNAPAVQVAPQVVVQARAVPLVSFGGFLGRWAFWREQTDFFLKDSLRSFDAKKLNSLLSVACVLTGVYLIVWSLLLFFKFSAAPSFSFKAAQAQAGQDLLKQASSLKPAAYYVEKVQSRDIFKIGRQVAGVSAQKDEAAIKALQESILSKYRLVGISWSDNPDVMVEDTASHKTYFLKRGQTIDNVKIQAVFKDKVILNSGGQEVELR